MVKRNCIICGKEFFAKPSRVNRGWAKYCSYACSQKGKIKRIKQNCKVCKREFLPRYDQTKRGKGLYCSQKCFRLWFRGDNHSLSGEKSHFWKGGITPEKIKIRVSPEYKLWRKAVFERDNYKCIWCDSNKEIEADHIKPFSLYPELRFAIDNGRTLCHQCHLTTDSYLNNGFNKSIKERGTLKK